MAKTGKNLQQLKEQQFDELIQKNWYYNDVYTYLLKFENEFTNNSLMDFIINCESATTNILIALLNDDNNKDLTIKYIIEQRGYYDRDSILNDFELYLTKFIVAHCLTKRYKEDKKRTDYFNQVLSICKSQSNIHKYYFDYHRGFFCTGNEWGVCADWHLRLNTKQYVIIDKKELAETLNKLKQTTTQPTPPQKEIEPTLIKWNGKNKNDLAYLFWKLQKEKIISINSFGNDLSKIFIDTENKKIENTLFNKYSSEFKNGKFPTNVNDIDKLIEILKKGIDKT